MLLPTAMPINEAEIDTLVDTFYARVRDDATIGPIFNAQVKDWPEHLALLKSFWASVLLGAGTFRGNPLEKHMMLPLEPQHFQVWLRLFRETALDVLRPEGTEMVVRRSERIAETFQAAIARSREI
jgi:hemoglobin